MNVTAAPASAVLFVAVLAIVVSSTSPGEAHKGVTSKFTYNDQVYPIFLNRCGHCHVAGGVGPMSLVNYEEAFPWAESLRTELLETETARGGESDGFIRVAHRDLPARELDVILDWATGGTPQGDPAGAPPVVLLKNEWTHGEPSLAVPLPAAYQMPADAMETTQEFVLPITLNAERDVSAIDVLPGNPAIVREVELLVYSADGSRRAAGTWAPKQNPAPIVVTPVARLTPASRLAVRIHYKKTWKYEGQSVSDHSTIGLYFAP
jgi:hypothetical protein